jgi:hypothetical protein
MNKRVVIKTQFAALHRWKDCPLDEVVYLRDYHRHVFHVVMKFDVSHSDRDIEFIMKKEEVEAHIKTQYIEVKYLGSLSCEMIAEDLLTCFGASFVSVFEDDENGAEVFV